MSPSLQCGEVWRLGKLLGSSLRKWQAQRMDKCEGDRLLQRGGTSRRTPTGHCTGYSGEKHGFVEADHRASRRSMSVILSYVCPHCHRFPFEYYIWSISCGHEKKEAMQLAVCGLQWTARVDGPEQSLGHPSRTADKQKCLESTLHRKECATI